MRNETIVYLMYHELEVDGRPLCQSEQGYVRYVVHESAFRNQMNWLQSSGMRGISVSNALSSPPPDNIVITFDDGCETDLIIAAPVLSKLGFGATFYITIDFLGRPGFMIPRQVRELSDAGFEIGCHSMTHAYLTDLNPEQLQREIGEAKGRLEEMIDRPVHHFSCPGGRWNPTVAEVARRAGYHSVTTSRIAVNRPQSNRFELARVVVMRDVALPVFQDLCRGRGLWQRQLRKLVQTKSHQILGNTLYDRLRCLILERRA
jgi:peptidoglycan/xylan/chitin deacetylase (PgdA/CDA1 family)